MSILNTTPGLLEALQGEMTPKFLASRNAAGIPNVVPVVSILPAEDQKDTLYFGNFLLRKTIKNLDQDPRVGILVITPELKGWILTGDFIEWQRTGAYVERQMNSNLLRYNAYTGIRNAGVIRVREVLASFSISKLQVVIDYLWARVMKNQVIDSQQNSVILPRPVRIEFDRMVAVKVLAWLDADGYPHAAPALSLQPAGQRSLAGRVKSYGLSLPESGSLVATNILTFDAISYQAKGRWAQQGSLGAVQVQEIFAGGPPKPGGKVA